MSVQQEHRPIEFYFYVNGFRVHKFYVPVVFPKLEAFYAVFIMSRFRR